MACSYGDLSRSTSHYGRLIVPLNELFHMSYSCWDKETHQTRSKHASRMEREVNVFHCNEQKTKSISVTDTYSPTPFHKYISILIANSFELNSLSHLLSANQSLPPIKYLPSVASIRETPSTFSTGERDKYHITLNSWHVCSQPAGRVITYKGQPREIMNI